MCKDGEAGGGVYERIVVSLLVCHSTVTVPCLFALSPLARYSLCSVFK